MGNEIALGPDGSIYVAGVFEETVDFDPSLSVNDLTALNWTDVFVLKLNAFTGVDENMSSVQLLVFPNPGQNWITVTAPDVISSVKILDAVGRVVETAQNESCSIRLDIDPLPKGTYQVMVICGSREVTESFIKL